MCEHQRDSLRSRWFKTTFPSRPLTVDIPYKGDARIELYGLNTVDHRMLPNAFARGVAAPDRFWESSPPMVGPSPADDMGRAAENFSDRGLGQHLRILATHYPVCDAAQAGRVFEILANRAAFANELATPRHVRAPVADLVLGGHTHVAFPDFGQMPKDIKFTGHTPLQNGICQVVGGSLSQESGIQTLPASASHSDLCRNLYPYQCTVIRIFHDRASPLNLTIERLTAGRARGGTFRFLPIAANSQSLAESMTVQLV